jgi:hemoglobin
MGVQRYQQNAQIEDLQKAMAEEHVPDWAQNRLLAKLAPLERVTVTR